MSEESRPARVGVRELRQNLSVYLDRVKDGETLEVTEHGRRVARLSPVPAPSVPILDRLVAEGRATRGRGSLADLQPPTEPAPGVRLTEVLLEMRDEERG